MRPFSFHLFPILMRYPRLLIAMIAVGGLLYAYEVIVARPKMVYMGIPAARGTTPMTWTRVFRNESYMSGYSDLRGNPLWIVYRLKPIPESAPRYKRPRDFSVDWRSLTHITSHDYTRSGYDRGHMAPNSAISRLYGKQAQLETFLMTNIVPQRPDLNQRVWQKLEELEATRYAKRFRELWVYTGPVFDKQITRLKSAWRVEIPDAFYKIYAGVDSGGSVHMLAFLIPQSVRGNEKPERFLTTVDRVEALSGFDFFHDLDDLLEERLESEVRYSAW
jgi:endonuclease G